MPPALDEWVPANHPVRFVRDFVDALNSAELGIPEPVADEGRPPYGPDLLLKVWLFGYMERIRSTRAPAPERSPLLCSLCGSILEQETAICPLCGHRGSRPESTTADPTIGLTLPGGYVILEMVGTGMISRVYRGQHQILQRTVAIKLVHEHLLDDEMARFRFITEARVTRDMLHPNLVRVIDVGSSGKMLYMVMDWAHGRSLARLMHEEGLLSFARIISIMSQVLGALEALHRHGVVHDNIHPEGIMIDETTSDGYSVKVLDLSRSRLLLGVDASRGFSSYASPERIFDYPHRSASSDLYACGVILFQLLTGRLPFEGDLMTQAMLKHTGASSLDPIQIASEGGIPQALVGIALIALKKTPDHRFARADIFMGALASVLPEFPPEPRYRGR